MYMHLCVAGACPGGGGGEGARHPPLEIKKQKNVIKANLKLLHLYFAAFFSRKCHFLSYFLSCPLPEKLKSKKNKL